MSYFLFVDGKKEFFYDATAGETAEFKKLRRGDSLLMFLHLFSSKGKAISYKIIEIINSENFDIHKESDYVRYFLEKNPHQIISKLLIKKIDPTKIKWVADET